MKRKCDFCGEEAERKNGNKVGKIFLCDKCMHVLKMLVLSHRKVKPV